MKPVSKTILPSMRHWLTAVTNARITSLRFASRALVTSGNDGRISGGLPSAALRRRCAPTPFQPSLRLRSTVSTRRPQTEAGCLSAPRHPALFDL